MEPLKLQKEKAIARFNCFRRIANLRQYLEAFLILGLISWSSSRLPPLLRWASASAVAFSTYLLNHHVVFLIGNAIVFMLFLLCRRSEGASTALTGFSDDLYEDYVKHSGAASAAADPPPIEAFNSPAPGGGEKEKEEEKQIVQYAAATAQYDDVAAAIEKARRQIKRFERTQSEKLKREIRPALRRSESQKRRNSVSCGERFEAGEIERLSSDEFRRTIDAFIDEKWRLKSGRNNELGEYQKCQLAY